MSLTIDSATARLSRQMRESETAIADALVATTGLLHTAALARREVGGVDAKSTHLAMLRIGKLADGLLSAQGDALRVHSQLTDIARETGATEEPSCPEEFLTSGEANQENIAA
ncbi:MAG: hypothetical protein R3E14_07400 [Erythrobacter sp.]